jgi:hypothetical protein
MLVCVVAFGLLLGSAGGFSTAQVAKDCDNAEAVESPIPAASGGDSQPAPVVYGDSDLEMRNVYRRCLPREEQHRAFWWGFAELNCQLNTGHIRHVESVRDMALKIFTVELTAKPAVGSSQFRLSAPEDVPQPHHARAIGGRWAGRIYHHASCRRTHGLWRDQVSQIHG